METSEAVNPAIYCTVSFGEASLKRYLLIHSTELQSHARRYGHGVTTVGVLYPFILIVNIRKQTENRAVEARHIQVSSVQ